MILKCLLYSSFIYYFSVFVACFIGPLIIGLTYDGINGLKDQFNSSLTDKNYYSQVVKPVFIFFSCIYIICILFVLFVLFIIKII